MHYKKLEWTDDLVKRLWEYKSCNPENYFTNQVGDKLVENLLNYLVGAKNVLDYGCGMGFLIPHLLKNNLEVTAMDFSQPSCDKVNEKFRNQRKFRGAFMLDDLLTQNNKFDIIFVIEVIEHLNDQYLFDLVKKLKLLLSQNGKIVITTPNDEDLKKKEVYCPVCNHTFHPVQHVRSWSEDSLNHFLVENGFKIITISTGNYSKGLEKPMSFERKVVNFIKYRLLFYSQEVTISVKQPHLTAIVTL